MPKIKLTITTTASGQIIITPPPGVELVINEPADTGAPDGYLTVAEAADRLGLSTKTISRYCTTGRLPGTRTVGNNYLVPIEALDAIAANPPRPGPRRKDSN